MRHGRIEGVCETGITLPNQIVEMIMGVQNIELSKMSV
jgi:hypothetical protein